MWPWVKREERYIVVDCSFRCTKEKCPKWVVLTKTITPEGGEPRTEQVGQCAIAWIPTLLVELKQAIERR